MRRHHPTLRPWATVGANVLGTAVAGCVAYRLTGIADAHLAIGRPDGFLRGTDDVLLGAGHPRDPPARAPLGLRGGAGGHHSPAVRRGVLRLGVTRPLGHRLGPRGRTLSPTPNEPAGRIAPIALARPTNRSTSHLELQRTLLRLGQPGEVGPCPRRVLVIVAAITRPTIRTHGGRVRRLDRRGGHLVDGAEDGPGGDEEAHRRLAR